MYVGSLRESFPDGEVNEWYFPPYWDGWRPKGPSISINRTQSLLVGTFFRLTGGSTTVNETPGGRETGAPPTRNAHGREVEKGRACLAVQ